MNNTMNRKRIILNLMCIVLSICLTACGAQTGSEGIFTSAKAKETDISIPEEITMEFFGMNLLEANRPMWEKHVFSLNELGADDYIYTTFPIGDYEVMHSYLNFQNKENFTSYITYGGDRSGTTQILFDENDNLLQIDIRSDMGEAFNTSFLNVGDNVKEYFESVEEGSWEKFLSDEKPFHVQEWIVRHSTVSMPEITYDTLMIYNDDIVTSYWIKDELVYNISLTVVGELAVNEEAETEKSVYNLDSFDFYLNGTDIATMSASDWLKFFNFSSSESHMIYKQKWLGILDFSDGHYKTKCPKGDVFVLFAGGEMGARVMYYEDKEYKSMILAMHPVTKKGDINTIDLEHNLPMISFSISKDGGFNIDLYIEGECSMITSNYVMPGDNIKTFLNSYEDGLYEKLVSLSDPMEEYCVGPYYFRFEDIPGPGDDIVEIGKRDENNSLPVIIRFEDETVTAINRRYLGKITGFEDKPSLR